MVGDQTRLVVSVPFTNPIIAGTTLVRQAIKSPDYVSGVSGWTINRDGSVEFSNAIVRGTMETGNTTLDNAGLHLIGDDGSRIDIEPGTFCSIEMSPPPITGYTVSPAKTYTSSNKINPGIPAEYVDATVTIESASINGSSTAAIRLKRRKGAVDNSAVELGADDIYIDGLLQDSSLVPYGRSQTGEESISFGTPTAVASYTTAVVFPFAFATKPSVSVNIGSGASATARWQARAISISTTGFTLFLFKGDNADPNATWSNVPVNWTATV